MKNILLLLIISLASFGGLVDYTNNEYNFEVKLPKDCKIENDKYEEKFASIENLRISGSEEISNFFFKGNLIYRVICFKYSKKPIIKTDHLNFRDVIIAYVKHQNKNSFITNSLAVTSKTENGDTLYYVLTNESKDLIEHRKIVFKDSSSYCLSLMSNKSFLKKEYIEDFFNSFKIR